MLILQVSRSRHGCSSSFYCLALEAWWRATLRLANATSTASVREFEAAEAHRVPYALHDDALHHLFVPLGVVASISPRP